MVPKSLASFSPQVRDHLNPDFLKDIALPLPRFLSSFSST